MTDFGKAKWWYSPFFLALASLCLVIIAAVVTGLKAVGDDSGFWDILATLFLLVALVASVVGALFCFVCTIFSFGEWISHEMKKKEGGAP